MKELKQLHFILQAQEEHTLVDVLMKDNATNCCDFWRGALKFC